LLQIDGARMVESGNPHGVVLGEGPVVILEPSRTTHSVRSIEVYGGPGTEPITLAGLSLLGEPADKVMDRLARHYAVRVEDSGQFVVMDDLLVALWRPYVPESPSDVEGRFFESVLVALPGYYDDEDRFAEVPDSRDGNEEVERIDTGTDEALF
jgi:hypothetical protein